jgi:hypothetical protein
VQVSGLVMSVGGHDLVIRIGLNVLAEASAGVAAASATMVSVARARARRADTTTKSCMAAGQRKYRSHVTNMANALCFSKLLRCEVLHSLGLPLRPMSQSTYSCKGSPVSDRPAHILEPLMSFNQDSSSILAGQVGIGAISSLHPRHGCLSV